MPDRAETLEFPVMAPGAAQAAGEFDKLGQSIGKTSADWNRMSQSSAKASAALGAMGTALGPLGAEFGALGANVSRASGIIGNMTALLGGPWGIAIGAAATAAGFLAKKFADDRAEAEKLTEKLNAQREAHLKLIADVEKAEAEAAEKRALRAREDLAYWDTKLRLLRENPDAVLGGKGPEPEKPKAGPAFKPRETEFGTADELAREQAQRDSELEALMSDMGRKGVEDQILADAAKKDEAAAQDIARDRALADERKAIWDEYAAYDAQRVEMQMQSERTLASLRKGLASDTVNVAMRSINEVVKGNKIGAKAVVQSIGDSLVARGTQAILEGTIFSATPFMWGSGTPMIAAGGAAIATGLALGAASRAIPGGGGGGGSRGSSTGTPQLAPATPVAPDRTGNGGRSPVVINVNMPTVVSPSGEDGARVQRAIDQARREGRI